MFRLCALSLELHTVWKWFLWLQAAGLAIRWTDCFSALVGVFRHCLLDFRCSWLLLHDFQRSNDLYRAERDPSSRRPLRFEFLFPFSLRRLWLSPFEDTFGELAYFLLWQPGVPRVPWPFQRLKVMLAWNGDLIRTFCELLLNPIWILISLALLASSQLSYLR